MNVLCGKLTDGAGGNALFETVVEISTERIVLCAQLHAHGETSEQIGAVGPAKKSSFANVRHKTTLNTFRWCTGVDLGSCSLEYFRDDKRS